MPLLTQGLWGLTVADAKLEDGILYRLLVPGRGPLERNAHCLAHD